MGFSRQQYWSGLPFPPPGDFPDLRIEPGSPALQADALPSEPPGKPVGSQKKQEISRKTSTASLTTWKPLTVWITTNCGKYWKRWEYQTDHLTCLLRNLYAGQESTVRTAHGTTDWFQIGKGVRQGCIMSLCLFNICRVHQAKCQAGWSTSCNQDCWEKYQ